MWKIVVGALCLSLLQIASLSAQSCFDDVNRCLPDFRNRYFDIDHFWFGTPFTLCPGLPLCINTNTNLQSVVSRVIWSTDVSTQQAAVFNMQPLNVTFEQPARRYYACDTWFDVPATSSVTVDPLGPTVFSQANAFYRPHVTWTPRTPQTLYTVVVVDISYMFLHGVYVNCPDGSWENGQAVMPWLGPSVPYLVNSPYTFMVFEQYSTISLQVAQQAVEETQAEGANPPLSVFQVSSLLQRLSAYVNPAIQFSVIMEMYSDPYGASRLTDFLNMLDLCPFFYSQLDAFHSAVRAMRIPDPKWSPPAFSLSQIEINAHLTSLTINVKVQYDTEDYTSTACCKKFTITRGSHFVSALDSRPVRAAMTRLVPRVSLDPIFFDALGGGRSSIAGNIYTLLMVDVTPALSSTGTGAKLTTHWLVTNIFGSDLETGTQVAPYFAPSPSNEYSPSAYMFLLFNQPNIVDPATLRSICPNGFERCELQVADLIQAWGLGDIVGVNWFQAKFDDFSLKQQYTALGRPEEMVCTGREGYAFPCEAAERTTYCSAIGQFGLSSCLLIGLLPVLVILLNQFKTA
ncbi:tyrosine-protein phosphatase non-receptor type 6 [Plakobranchus ocellatus]|uniref:Tyrosine-protein phosphatase non-receptor type 6 n=1 Tax=Plakobranchus ocellatus TaxID=259542 RepID=A0AAV3YZU9_9GAST|nr:tyrosine-protein phosphatase non-receptor type 6 [Plakobranchus ocellatus]